MKSSPDTESPKSQSLVSDQIPSLLGLAKLLTLGFDEVNLSTLWRQLADRFVRDNTDVAPLMDICILDQILGQTDRGLAFQKQALQERRLFQIQADQKPARLRVLGFTAAGVFGNNTPIEFLIQDSNVTLYLIYVVSGSPLPPVPEHDVAFVVAGECEENRPVLQELEVLLRDWSRPVLNAPGRIPQVGRERFYRVVEPIGELEMPATVRISRALWQSVGNSTLPIQAVLAKGVFPVIVRPVDSHAGHGLQKIDRPDEIAAYLAKNSGREFYLSCFVDYQNADGLYRKYRVAVIDGVAYPCHMGVSENWMVHYVNAGMLESEAKRAEEARFMACFEEEFGGRHRRAFANIATILGLEYFGLDCAETPDGKLLIFEADTAMIVHDMDPADVFPYKKKHMQILFEAFRSMLHRHAQ